MFKIIYSDSCYSQCRYSIFKNNSYQFQKKESNNKILLVCLNLGHGICTYTGKT